MAHSSAGFREKRGKDHFRGDPRQSWGDGGGRIQYHDSTFLPMVQDGVVFREIRPPSLVFHRGRDAGGGLPPGTCAFNATSSEVCATSQQVRTAGRSHQPEPLALDLETRDADRSHFLESALSCYLHVALCCCARLISWSQLQTPSAPSPLLQPRGKGPCLRGRVTSPKCSEVFNCSLGTPASPAKCHKALKGLCCASNKFVKMPSAEC